MAKMTVKDLLEWKKNPHRKKLIAINTHDYYTALAAAEAGTDYIVYDVKGPMEYITPKLKELRQAAPDVILCTAMSRESAVTSDESALRDGIRLLNAGVDVIYCMGMPVERIKKLTKAHIPCVGHLGLIPYQSTWTGGFKAVGKTPEQAEKVYRDAMELNDAGVIAAELECIPQELAKYISERVDYITLSMGAGPDCDAQYLFACDLLGTRNVRGPRHSKQYDNFYGRSVDIFKQFIQETNEGIYPAKQHVIEMPEDTYSVFQGINPIDSVRPSHY